MTPARLAAERQHLVPFDPSSGSAQFGVLKSTRGSRGRASYHCILSLVPKAASRPTREVLRAARRARTWPSGRFRPNRGRGPAACCWRRASSTAACDARGTDNETSRRGGWRCGDARGRNGTDGRTGETALLVGFRVAILDFCWRGVHGEIAGQGSSFWKHLWAGRFLPCPACAALHGHGLNLECRNTGTHHHGPDFSLVKDLPVLSGFPALRFGSSQPYHEVVDCGVPPAIPGPALPAAWGRPQGSSA